jgi:hypothetical protein
LKGLNNWLGTTDFVLTEGAIWLERGKRFLVLLMTVSFSNIQNDLIVVYLANYDQN